MKRNKTPYKKRYTARKKFEFGQPQRPLADRKIPAGVELKCVDVLGGTTMNMWASSEERDILNLTVVGTNSNNRIGKRIKMHSIFLRGFIAPSMANAAAATEDFKRIMIVYDRQPNSAEPASGLLFSSTNVSGTPSNTAFDNIDIARQQRFWVLMDDQVWTPALGALGASTGSVHSCDGNTNAGSSKGTLNITRYIKLKGLETVYTGNAGTIADIVTGSLLLVTYAAYDTNATSAYQLYYSARLRYWDA